MAFPICCQGSRKGEGRSRVPSVSWVPQPLRSLPPPAPGCWCLRLCWLFLGGGEKGHSCPRRCSQTHPVLRSAGVGGTVSGWPSRAQACTGFLAWAESTPGFLRRGWLLEGLLETSVPSRLSSCSLPPAFVSDIDNPTLIHMFCGPHPDPHLHRHTHLRTQYTSCQHAASTRAQRDCHLKDLPQAPAAMHMLHTWPLHTPRAPTPHCRPHCSHPSIPSPVPTVTSSTLTLFHTHLHSLGHSLPSQTPTHAHPPTHTNTSHALTGHH